MAAGGSTVERIWNCSTRRANSCGSKPSITTTGAPTDTGEEHLVDPGPQRQRHRDEVRHRRLVRRAAVPPRSVAITLSSSGAHAVVLEQHRLRPAGGARGELHERDAGDRSGASPSDAGSQRHARRRPRPPDWSPKRPTCSGTVTITAGLDRLDDVGEVGCAEAGVERHVHAAGPPDPEQRGDDVGVRQHHAHRRCPVRRRRRPARTRCRSARAAHLASEWSTPAGVHDGVRRRRRRRRTSRSTSDVTRVHSGVPLLGEGARALLLVGVAPHRHELRRAGPAGVGEAELERAPQRPLGRAPSPPASSGRSSRPAPGPPRAAAPAGRRSR